MVCVEVKDHIPKVRSGIGNSLVGAHSAAGYVSTQPQPRKSSQMSRLAVLPQSQTFGYYIGFDYFVHHRDKQSKSDTSRKR